MESQDDLYVLVNHNNKQTIITFVESDNFGEFKNRVKQQLQLRQKFDVYHNKTKQRLFFKDITLMGGILQVNALGNGDDLSIKPIIESPTYWENLCRYFYK
jgi:hypothetical protein